MASIPFNTQIVRLLAVFGLTVFLASLAATAIFDSRDVKRNLSTMLTNEVELSQALLVEYITANREYVERVIAELAAKGADPGRDFEVALHHLDPGDDYFVLDQAGRIEATGEIYREYLGLDLSHLPYVQKEQAISPVHQALFRSQPVVTFTFPLPGGRLLLVEEDLREILARLRYVSSTLESDTLLIILAEDGTVVFHPEEELIKSRYNLGFEMEAVGDRDRFGLQQYRISGKNYYCYRQELEMPAGWTVHSCLPVGRAEKILLQNITVHVVIFGLAIAGLLLLLHFLIKRRISLPIARLSRHLTELNPLAREERLPEALTHQTLELVRILEAVKAMSANVRSANAQLMKNEELFRLVTEFSLDWAYWLAPTGTISYIAPSCERITGYTQEEFYREPDLLVETVHPEERELFRRHKREAEQGQAHEPLEFRILTKQGAVRWISHVCQSIYRDGQFMGVRGSNTDITARKQAEETLRASEARFRTLVEQAADGFFLHDQEGRIIDVNQQACDMLGYQRQELLELSVTDIEPEAEPRKIRAFWQGMQEGRTYTLELALTRKDGSSFPSEVRMRLLPWGEGKVILGLVRDVSERKQAAEALAKEKELLNVTLRSMGEGMVCTDREGRITIFNPMAEKLTGWSEQQALGRLLKEVFCLMPDGRAECPDPVAQVLATGQLVESSSSCRLRAKGGEERQVVGSSSPIFNRENHIVGVVAVFRDISEQRKLEEEASKAEKLESLGILAGGIAHDFNNLLTAVLGNISLARMHLDPQSRAALHLDSAERASMRTRDLTQQLLTFARGGAPIKQTTSIVDLIRDTAGFVLRGSNVKLELSLPPDLWQVEVDPGQMSQVISNLVINANQAMPQGGILEIGGQNFKVEEGQGVPLKSGRYVQIRVRDRGIGIPREHLRYIFDPYFTTKQKGSGLGLASSYSIIKRHEGHIDVESEPGKGTTFFLYLPASLRSSLSEPAEGEAQLLGEGKVLIMDDDEMVRELAGELLSHLGYEVEFAADGREAVAKYAEAFRTGEPHQLVIMDLTIPGGTGAREAVRVLLEIDPSAKAVVASGYLQDPVMQEPEKYGFSGVLHKPFNIRELVRLLQRLTPVGVIV